MGDFVKKIDATVDRKVEEKEKWVELNGRLLPVVRMERIAKEKLLRCLYWYNLWEKQEDSPDRDYYLRWWSKRMYKPMNTLSTVGNLLWYAPAHTPPSKVKEKFPVCDSIPPILFEEEKDSSDDVGDNISTQFLPFGECVSNLNSTSNSIFDRDFQEDKSTDTRPLPIGGDEEDNDESIEDASLQIDDVDRKDPVEIGMVIDLHIEKLVQIFSRLNYADIWLKEILFSLHNKFCCMGSDYFQLSDNRSLFDRGKDETISSNSFEQLIVMSFSSLGYLLDFHFTPSTIILCANDVEICVEPKLFVQMSSRNTVLLHDLCEKYFISDALCCGSTHVYIHMLPGIMSFSGGWSFIDRVFDRGKDFEILREVYNEKLVSVVVSKHAFTSDEYSTLLSDLMTGIWSSVHPQMWSDSWSNTLALVKLAHWFLLDLTSFFSFTTTLLLFRILYHIHWESFAGMQGFISVVVFFVPGDFIKPQFLLLHGVLMFPKDPGKLVVAHQLLLEMKKAHQWPSRLQNNVIDTSSGSGVQFAHLCEASFAPTRRSSFSLTSVPSAHLTVSEEVMQWVVPYFCTHRRSCNGEEEDNYDDTQLLWDVHFDVVHRKTLLPGTAVATRVMRTIYHSPCYNQVVEYPTVDIFGFHDFSPMISLQSVNCELCFLHYAHLLRWPNFLRWEFKFLSPGLWSVIHNGWVSRNFSSAVIFFDSYWYSTTHLFFEIEVHKDAAFCSTADFMQQQTGDLKTRVQTLPTGEFLLVMFLISMAAVPTGVWRTDYLCANPKLSVQWISFFLHFSLPVFEVCGYFMIREVMLLYWSDLHIHCFTSCTRMMHIYSSLSTQHSLLISFINVYLRETIQFWFCVRTMHLLLNVVFVPSKSRLVNFLKWKFKCLPMQFWTVVHVGCYSQVCNWLAQAQDILLVLCRKSQLVHLLLWMNLLKWCSSTCWSVSRCACTVWMCYQREGYGYIQFEFCRGLWIIHFFVAAISVQRVSMFKGFLRWKFRLLSCAWCRGWVNWIPASWHSFLCFSTSCYTETVQLLELQALQQITDATEIRTKKLVLQYALFSVADLWRIGIHLMTVTVRVSCLLGCAIFCWVYRPRGGVSWSSELMIMLQLEGNAMQPIHLMQLLMWQLHSCKSATSVMIKSSPALLQVSGRSWKAERQFFNLSAVFVIMMLQVSDRSWKAERQFRLVDAKFPAILELRFFSGWVCATTIDSRVDVLLVQTPGQVSLCCQVRIANNMVEQFYHVMIRCAGGGKSTSWISKVLQLLVANRDRGGEVQHCQHFGLSLLQLLLFSWGNHTLLLSQIQGFLRWKFRLCSSVVWRRRRPQKSLQELVSVSIAFPAGPTLVREYRCVTICSKTIGNCASTVVAEARSAPPIILCAHELMLSSWWTGTTRGDTRHRVLFRTRRFSSWHRVPTAIPLQGTDYSKSRFLLLQVQHQIFTGPSIDSCLSPTSLFWDVLATGLLMGFYTLLNMIQALIILYGVLHLVTILEDKDNFEGEVLSYVYSSGVWFWSSLSVRWGCALSSLDTRWVLYGVARVFMPLACLMWDVSLYLLLFLLLGS